MPRTVARPPASGRSRGRSRSRHRQPPQGVGELREVQDPILEQIAEPGRADQVEALAQLDVLRKQQDAHVGTGHADPSSRAGSVGLQPRWHADVCDHDVRLQVTDSCFHRVRVAHGRQHVVAGVGEQAHQAFPEQHRVLTNDEAHHNIAVTVVPVPGGDEIVTVPPTDSTRSRSAVNVRDRDPADPVVADFDAQPSRPWSATRTPTRVACACLSELVTASETTR